jgi:transposase
MQLEEYMKKHIKIQLEETEIETIYSILKSINYSYTEKRRARVLLKLHKKNVNHLNQLTSEIAKEEHISNDTICNIKRRYFETNSVEETIKRKERTEKGTRNRLPLECKKEIINLAKSTPPAEKNHWTYRSLCDYYNNKMTNNKISHTTVMNVLKTENIHLK